MTRPLAPTSSQSLEKVAAFAGLSPESRARIEKRCTWRRYQAGESIVDYLDPSRDVFFIAAGEVRASIYSLLGKGVLLSDLGAGSMFGEIAAIDGAPRSASIEARTPCVVATMSATAFREVVGSEPEVALALVHHLVGKIRELTTRVYEFSALGVSHRIQAELLRIARLAPREGKAARIAEVPTHAEIASRIRTHREAVTKELARLARTGVIERRGRALLVKDLERLEAMVHDATGE